MGFRRKLERNNLKEIYKKQTKNIQHRYRNFFAKLWSDYQDKKFGKKEHHILVVKSSK